MRGVYRVKKLIPAFILLLVSAILLSTASYAWFSMNSTVMATNMSVKATTGPSLVISDTTTFTAGNIEVSKSAVDVTLMPATAYRNTMLDNTNAHAALSQPSTNLVYVANANDVSPTTGLARTGKTLYYSAVTLEAEDGGDPGFYFDYVFYIAAEGDTTDIDNGSLVINMDAVDFSGFNPAEAILQAVTVQPYVNGTLTGNPIRIKDGVSDQELIADLSSEPIPSGAPGAVATAIEITLRVYIDGALLESEGITYVKNASIVDLTRAASFDVEFSVVTD
jgi:hypothetical protein